MVEREDDKAQLLLATGIVLMLSLLSMAWFGISVAGLGDPYDPGEGEVLRVTQTVQDSWEPLLVNRTDDFVSGGYDWQESVDAAANSSASDLMRHGEQRGVEIVITDISATNNSGVFTVTADIGIADRHSRMRLAEWQATIEIV